MDLETQTLITKHRLRVKISRKDISGEPFSQNVLNGLTAENKKLSPKFLYDKIGSQLFEQICELPEYYPTRTERTIIIQSVDGLIKTCGANIELVELGSGSSMKTRLLIEAFLRSRGRLHYIPIDISKSMLVQSAKRLLRTHDTLSITALVSDYQVALQALAKRKRHPKLILFLGSSIGNFSRHDAENFLLQVRQSMGPQDRLLIGMDLVKSRKILLPAYDDSQGITAQFNLNLLARINRELDGEFDLDSFRHHVIYNDSADCIELYLLSKREQTVKIGKLERAISFKKNERIHTENSHKYSKDVIADMTKRNGFILENAWYDDREWFSLNMLKPV